jgi:hypothetical protein
LAHGLQGMKFIDAAVQSSKEGHWVNL